MNQGQRSVVSETGSFAIRSFFSPMDEAAGNVFGASSRPPRSAA